MWYTIVLLTTACTIYITLCVGEKVRYDGYQVLRIIPGKENELNALRDLQNSALGAKIDFWKGPTYLNRPVDIMVSPESIDDVIQSLWRGGVSKLHTFIEDVQAKLEEANSPMVRMAKFNYTNFNTIETINQWITDTAAAYHTVTEGSLGTSYEGRRIHYLKISHGGPKKAVILNGGIHAREWLSPATLIYIVKQLVGGSTAAIHLLNLFDFYIIPVLNVDGYAYTWTTDRFWRKTRSNNSNTPYDECVGTDPNRNFDIDWKDVNGSSSFPCSDIYRGPHPFSEVEIASLRDFVIRLGGGTNNGHGGNVAMFIDYHTYSQLWVFPFGYKLWDTPREKPDKPGGGDGGGNNEVGSSGGDRKLLENGAYTAVEALKKVHGTEYKVGDVFSTIYPVSGCSNDYMYEVHNIKFSYATEGRDRGLYSGRDSEPYGYGFVAPPSEIQPSGEENWAALEALCNYIFQHI